MSMCVTDEKDRPAARLTGQNCVICQDPIRGGQIRAPCGHYYDIACVKELFQAAIRDESLFPPRCCRTEILFAYVRPHLTATEVTLFNDKQTELATPNRVYCANPSCSRFLGPKSTGFFSARSKDCSALGCNTRTCLQCKGKMEVATSLGHQCKADEADEQVLALGRTAGWARCPSCAVMIELNLGCFHMTCRCRAEFCYLCTARWKTCACPQWDERRLVVAAAERVDQRFGPAPAAALPRPHHVPPAQRHQVNRVEPPRRVVPPAALRFGTVAVERPNSTARLAQQPEETLAETLNRTWAIMPTPALATPRLRNITSATQPPASAGHRAVPTPAAIAPLTRTIAQPIRRAEPNTANMTRQPQPVLHDASAERARTAAAALRERRIREVMEELRENHDCAHTKWQYRSGGGVCQTCTHKLPHYLFVSASQIALSSRLFFCSDVPLYLAMLRLPDAGL